MQSLPKAAFPIGAIIVLLWQRYPVFGQVFLGYLVEKCPYIVGYYPAKEREESDVSHRIACGYVYGADNATLESEESFLNRMRAMVRVYGAIIQSPIRSDHPRGPKHGWMFLSRTLNSEPRASLTAAILHAFLSASFHKLLVVYQRQMEKLIAFILMDFLNRIEKNSTQEVKKQSIAQLELFVKDVQKQIRSRNAKALKPEGLIPGSFFESSYLNSF